MKIIYCLFDCDHKAIGNPMGYKTESAARAVANNPKNKAYASIKQAWRAKVSKWAFLDNRYQSFDHCYQIETFYR